MTAPDRTPEDLVTLQLPRQAVRELERALKTGVIRLALRDGGRPSPVTDRIIRELHAAATRTSSGTGTPTTTPTTVDHGIASRLWCMEEVAAVLGCSVEYARRLARSGRLRAQRVGANWAVHPTDLDAYRYGRQEDTSGQPGPAPAHQG